MWYVRSVCPLLSYFFKFQKCKSCGEFFHLSGVCPNGPYAPACPFRPHISDLRPVTRTKQKTIEEVESIFCFQIFFTEDAFTLVGRRGGGNFFQFLASDFANQHMLLLQALSGWTTIRPPMSNIFFRQSRLFWRIFFSLLAIFLYF